MSKQVKKPADEKKPAAKEQKKTDVASKEAAVAKNSTEATQDTGKEKESLKSTKKAPKGMTFSQAEAEMEKGVPVKLPEWGGFWFKKISGDGTIYVLTSDGQLLDSPRDEYKQRNDWQVAAPTDEQSAILEAFWEQKKASEEVAKRNALKAVYFNRGGGSFVKTPGKFTVADLMERKYPNGTMIDSEFLLENGQVFSVKEGRITNKDLSSELQILKKQK